MSDGKWTAEDVARINAKRGAQLPAHQPARKLTHEPQPARGHKYRAEPCIVTPDLTLFSKEDIYRVVGQVWEKGKPLPLKRLAAQAGIVGEWFGSLKEGRRWIELRRLEQAGFIHALRRQVPYALMVNGTRLGEWRADFVYEERHPDRTVEWIEDTKGHVLPLDKWKRAHVAAQYQIKIRIT